MSRIKQDWSVVKGVPGLVTRRDWHGGRIFGAICPKCSRVLEGPSMAELAERVCECGWRCFSKAFAPLVRRLLEEVKGE